MFDLKKYEKHLEIRPDGVYVKDDTPDDVYIELRNLNKVYKKIYHVDLFHL